jgi:hypothetical protein
MSAERPKNHRPVRRLRWQYSLRSLFILITVAAVVLAIRQPVVREYRKQRKAADELSDAGATIEFEPIRPAPLRWLVADSSLNRITTVKLEHRRLPEQGLAMLADLHDLERLYLPGTAVTDEDLVHIAGLTELRRLALWKTKITDRGLAHLEGLENLEILDVHATRVTQEGLVHLERLPRLRRLITTMTLSDQGLACLTRFAHHPLVIRGPVKVERVSDEGMAHLGTLKLVERLEMRHSEVSAEGFAQLAQLPKLERLDIETTPCDDAALAQLRRVPQLRKLYIRGPTKISLGGITRCWGERMRTMVLRLTPAGNSLACSGEEIRWMTFDFAAADLDSLAECRNVEGMGLVCSRLNEEMFAGIGQMVNLRRLSLRFGEGRLPRQRVTAPWPDGTNASQHLAGLTRLERLSVLFWALTDDQLVFLEALPGLSSLSLCGAEITGVGFAQIRQRSRLSRVDIDKCPQFNDEGLAQLLALKELRHVRLTETGISEEAGTAMVERLGEGFASFK